MDGWKGARERGRDRASGGPREGEMKVWRTSPRQWTGYMLSQRRKGVQREERHSMNRTRTLVMYGRPSLRTRKCSESKGSISHGALPGSCMKGNDISNTIFGSTEVIARHQMKRNLKHRVTKKKRNRLFAKEHIHQA